MWNNSITILVCMSVYFHCLSLIVWKHLLLILITGVYTRMLKQNNPPLGAVRQSLDSFKISLLCEQNCWKFLWSRGCTSSWKAMLKLELQCGKISMKMKFKWNWVISVVKIKEPKGWRTLEEWLINSEVDFA